METIELASRLAVAMVAGAALGLERELRSKDAGLRTHTLVAMGSATYLLIAADVAIQLRVENSQMVDPLRVLGSVIGGIGFLVAGIILQRRGNVHGLTTAASLWVSAALGAAAGLGQYTICLLAAGMSLLVLWPIHFVEQMIRPKEHHEDKDSHHGHKEKAQSS